MSQDDAPRPRPRPRPAPPEAPATPAPRPVAPPATAAEALPTAPTAADVPTVGEPAGPAPVETRPTRSARRRAQLRTGRRGARAAVLVGRLVAVLAVAAGVIVFVAARRDGGPSASPAPSTAALAPQARLTDPTAAQSFVSAAVSEVVAVTESDYRRLDDTLQSGLQVTTGAFRTSFQQALTGQQAQHLRAVRRVTSISVLASGIGTMSADGSTAKVLIFGRLDQSGTDIAAADRSFVTTLVMTLTKRGSQYLISGLQYDTNAGVPPGTAGLRSAAEAARVEVLATLTYRRAQFAADLAAAKAGAAGTLLAQIQDTSKATLSRMTKGGYDLRGDVRGIAAQQVTDNAAVFLVAATGTRVRSGVGSSLDSNNHYAVVVQRDGDAWIATSITPIT